ncbi:hypothetical protein HDU76_006871 [Blyttiomyces sp. JEL0837]|nr:hypothetical protein HDU76_006871 [Blyttiomyces sp. JEL0837]
MSISLADFPPEVMDEIACRLHPRFVHRLSLTSKTFFNRYSYPTYLFAKNNLEWHPAAIVDVVAIEGIMSGDDEDEDNHEAFQPPSTMILHHDMINLGDQYLAACIAISSLKQSLKLFLDLDMSKINVNEQDTWFLDFTSSKAQHFCYLLSIASIAGDLDLSQANFLVVYFLTAIEDFDTLFILQSKSLLPTDSHHSILTHAIQRNHNNIATWILSLNVVDPSVMENNAFMTAVEAGNVLMIETLLQDVRVYSTIDWNAAMIRAIESDQGENMELLQLIYHKEKTDLWILLPRLPLDGFFQSFHPYRNAFELLTADWNDQHLSHNFQDNCTLFNVSVVAGSLRMVKLVKSWFDWDSPMTPNLLYGLQLARSHQHSDIILYFIQHFSRLKEYTSCVIEAAMVNNLEMLKFFTESAVQEGYTDIWKSNFLSTAAELGHIDIVNYVLSLDQVDISSCNNAALESAIIFNHPRVVELLFQSGRLVNTEMWRWNRKIETSKYWGNIKVRGCFDCWFHEVCYRRFYHFVCIFLEYRDQIGLDISDGFAFRMAATLQPCEEDDDYYDSAWDDESVSTDSSQDESDFEIISASDSHSMDWTRTDDNSAESARFSFVGDRIAICELLLQTGTAIPSEISTDIINAASSLPFHLFNMVIDQGQYTTQSISEVVLKNYECLEIAIRANQLEVFEYLWSFRDTFEYDVLYSALHTAVLYNRTQFVGLIVKSIDKMDEGYDRGGVWYDLLVNMVKKNWNLDFVKGVWVKMKPGVMAKFYKYVVDNGVVDVINALTNE